MTIDIPTLQSWMAAANQLLNAGSALIPGQLGDTVRQWVSFIETIEANPVAQQLIVFLINNLSNLQKVKTVEDAKKLVEGFTVTASVA